MKNILFLVLLFFIAGCASSFESATHTPTADQTPSPAPEETSISTPEVSLSVTVTSTHQPPLKSHEWTPQPILAQFSYAHLNKDTLLHPAEPPRFILYADGMLLITRPLTMGSPYNDQQLLARQLSREETCRILNTLDQTGFIDYDPETYQFIGGEPNIKNAVAAYMEVNAWKSHQHTYNGLPLYILEELTGTIAFNLSKGNAQKNPRSGFPVISPALRSA